MEKRIVVLGGSGFIGKNLIKTILEETVYKVLVYDRAIDSDFKQYLLKYYERVESMEEDFFSEKNKIDFIVEDDIVIHLISSVTPFDSMQNILKPYKNDLIKSIDLLEKCKEKKIKKIIFISSGGTVYGETTEVSLREQDATNPINHYGIVKLAIEKNMLMYNHLYNMENIVLRVANPYGLNQKSKSKVGALAIFMDKIINDEEIIIYGDDEAVRDYIEISDVVNSILKSIDYKRKEGVVPVFNIGTGVGTSLKKLILEIETIINKKAKFKLEHNRRIDVKKNVLNIEKSKKELGLIPKITLIEGIEKYYKENYNQN